jgi:hypothetical protein
MNKYQEELLRNQSEIVKSEEMILGIKDREPQGKISYVTELLFWGFWIYYVLANHIHI